MYVQKTELLSIKKGIKYLKNSDPDLIPLLDSFEIKDLVPEKNYFKSLTRSIIYQQLSGSSAKAIFGRFVKLYDGENYPSPSDILSTEHDALRSVGLSRSKSDYLKNIAQSFLEDPLGYEHLDKMSDRDIIRRLTTIKGIGPWTAQMFLIFTLCRKDVLPITDLAMKKGYQKYYKMEDLPTEKEMLKKAEIWRPFSTVVSLYLWHLLEGPFEW